MEFLTGAFVHKRLGNGILGAHDKFAAFAPFGKIHYTRCRTDVIRHCADLGTAFGVDKQKRIRVGALCVFRLLDRYRRMHRTAAVKQLYVLVGKSGGNIGSEIAIRNEQNIFVFYRRAYLYRGRTGHADIAYSLKRCGGVHICYDSVTGIFVFHALYHLSRHLLRHRTARIRIGEINMLFRRKYLHGFRHESDAAHYYVLFFYRLRL